jgi:uncharacterized protein YchJ
MKKINYLLGTLMLATSMAQAAVKVEQEENGIYWAQYDYVKRNSLVYTVDTIGKVCFVASLAGGGVTYALTEVDCKFLANRPEWKSIINWL